MLSATAPLSPQLAAQAEAALGGRLIEIYGCTEAGQVATRRTTAGRRWATLGGPAPAARRTSDDGERFVVGGGHVAEPTPLGRRAGADRRAQRFRLLGRANDLIHVAGKRSSLAHLNFHLNSIDGVDDGAFWLPDEVADGVVRPVAFVVAPSCRARAIIAALRQRVERGLRAAPRGPCGGAAARGDRQAHRARAARIRAADARLAADDDARRRVGVRRRTRRPPGVRRPLSRPAAAAGRVLLADVLEAVRAPAGAGAAVGATPQIGRSSSSRRSARAQRVDVRLRAARRAASPSSCGRGGVPSSAPAASSGECRR